MIDAGKLRHRVTFLHPGPKDAAGGAGPDVEGASTWAEIAFVTGREVYQGAAFTSSVTHRVTMRWRPGVRTSQKLKYKDPDGDHIYEIQYVNNVEQKRERLDLFCIEISGGGAGAC